MEENKEEYSDDIENKEEYSDDIENKEDISYGLKKLYKIKKIKGSDQYYIINDPDVFYDEMKSKRLFNELYENDELNKNENKK